MGVLLRGMDEKLMLQLHSCTVAWVKLNQSVCVASREQTGHRDWAPLMIRPRPRTRNNRGAVVWLWGWCPGFCYCLGVFTVLQACCQQLLTSESSGVAWSRGLRLCFLWRWCINQWRAKDILQESRGFVEHFQRYIIRFFLWIKCAGRERRFGQNLLCIS